jgi:integrative and conjugative element protein (TIGR02256 family)
MRCVWITRTAQEQLIAAATKANPNETGGVLMGYRAEGNTIAVSHVIGPGPHSTQTPITFVPDDEFHRAEVARVYDDTGRISVYLGDWHSHPGGAGALSTTDLRTLRRIGSSASARAPEPLMVIVSGGPRWDITVYQLQRRRFRRTLEQLVLCDGAGRFE